MPRSSRRTRGKEVVIPTNSLVASSARYPGRAQRIYLPTQEWQRECYRHYTICGEARFAANFFGHSLSRATLGVATMDGSVVVPTDTGPAWDLLQELFAGKDGQTQMLNSLGVHLTIAGECYLVGRQVAGIGDVWEIVSVLEMQVSGTTWYIKYDDGMPPIELTEKDVVIRIWTPSPAKRIEADSPFRSLLPILGEIEWLTRHVFAQITSRLSSAGLLFVNSDVDFPPPPEQEGVTIPENKASRFMMMLGEMMLAPIEDPSNPAAVVPGVAMVPGDQMENAAKLVTFWTELDSEAKNLRDEAIRRFALGMDLPPEQVLGMSSSGGTGGGTSNGVSHWGAWQIEESTIKLHVEPMLDVVVNALTMGYLRPALDDPAPFVIHDTTNLKLRPDRSKEAAEAYDRGELSGKAYRRETGFPETDKPTEEELQFWLTKKIAGGSSTPEMVDAAARALGVQLEIAAPSIDQTTEERPPPSLIEHPTRPRTPAEAASLLLAASEPLVFRALERAGNRLRAAGSRPPGVPAYETHLHIEANGSADKAMEDAWSCAHQTLGRVVDDPSEVIRSLNAYCIDLIQNKQPHTHEALAKWLEDA
jgi:hypothetical protein